MSNEWNIIQDYTYLELRVTFNKYTAIKGTSVEEIHRIHFIAETAMGVLFLFGLSTSFAGLVRFFLGSSSRSFAEWIIKKNE